MRLTRALMLSVLATLVLTLILQSFFGARAFGLFLLLPLSFLFRRRPRPSGHPHEPIEPT